MRQVIQNYALLSGLNQMPIYEYECKQCKETFEIIVSDTKEKQVCEKCGEELKKIVSLSTFRLLGTGWYETDFKGK